MVEGEKFVNKDRRDANGTLRVAAFDRNQVPEL